MASETTGFLSAVFSCPLPSIPLSQDQSLDLCYSAINSSLPQDSSLVAQTFPPQLLCLKLQLRSRPQHHIFYLWFDLQAIFP